MTVRQEFLFEQVLTPAPPNPSDWLQAEPEAPPVRPKSSEREYPLRPAHRFALEKVFDSYRLKLNGYRLESTYYRYAGLSHTIRIRNKSVLVRISHFFEDQSERTVEAVAHILLRKLLRMRPLPEEVEICRRAERELEDLVPAREIPAPHPILGNHAFLPSFGGVHDLRAMCDRVVRRFFPPEYSEVPVFWSAKRARGYWGKYFSKPPRIVINRRLNSTKVPGWVVEAVLYHELLHHHLGIPVINGRRRAHTREFREAEQRYPLFEEAEAFLKKFR